MNDIIIFIIIIIFLFFISLIRLVDFVSSIKGTCSHSCLNSWLVHALHLDLWILWVFFLCERVIFLSIFLESRNRTAKETLAWNDLRPIAGFCSIIAGNNLLPILATNSPKCSVVFIFHRIRSSLRRCSLGDHLPVREGDWRIRSAKVCEGEVTARPSFM